MLRADHLNDKYMRRLFLLLPVAWALAACVDGDYDLGDVDTDGIAVGDDRSQFDAPMARIRVSLDEINSGGLPLAELLGEADAWLPSQLPDGEWVDLVRLGEEADYRLCLTDALLEQMLADDAKMDEVAALVARRYADEFGGQLDLPDGASEEEFVAAFRAVFRTDAALRERVRAKAAEYLVGLEISDLEFDLGRLTLDDVLDMLLEYLDPKGTPDPVNTLSVEGEITSRLPLAVALQPAFSPADIRIERFVVEADAASTLPSTYIYAEELRALCDADRVRVTLPVELLRYYPGSADALPDEPISIRLFLRKRGALGLDL